MGPLPALHALMTPPDRFTNSTFAAYRPETQRQHEALTEAKRFVEYIRAEHTLPWTKRLGRWIRRGERRWKGLYLVGPVGTGKTHLLASMYHALHPEVPCAFLHSGELFRAQTPPKKYAHQLAHRYRVLCLDEVELDDAANEARLVHTLKALEKLGVFLLATSNVEPEKFLSAAFGGDRFRRFLSEEFRAHYRVVLVGGEDYRRRLPKPGEAWIGAPAQTTPKLEAAFSQAPEPKRWLSFRELLAAATQTAHTRLITQLAAHNHLFLSDIAIGGTDDALRLLRVIDDLYLQPDPPTLYFTARTLPEDWFTTADAHVGLEQGIAEKFRRTVSRLYALCQVHELGITAGEAE